MSILFYFNHKFKFFFTLFFIFFLLIFFKIHAFGHNRLMYSVPKFNVSIEKIPSTLTLVFDGSITKLGYSAIVLNPVGTDCVQNLIIDKNKLLINLHNEYIQRNGKYQISWRIVSEDGHPIGGVFNIYKIVNQADNSNQNFFDKKEEYKNKINDKKYTYFKLSNKIVKLYISLILVLLAFVYFFKYINSKK